MSLNKKVMDEIKSRNLKVGDIIIARDIKTKLQNEIEDVNHTVQSTLNNLRIGKKVKKVTSKPDGIYEITVPVNKW